MKKTALLLFFLFVFIAVEAQNRVLHVDGADNKLCTGIGFMQPPWTLEAWIKGDDSSWKPIEVLFGGGEYSTFTQSDNYPLVLRNGKLYSTKADLESDICLDAEWHHVAATCDGKQTTLYLDGEAVASKEISVTIIPGALCYPQTTNSVFAGCMDEVRIWRTALSRKQIKQWMSIPINSTHPCFKNLIAYYNFDSEIDDVAPNWMGSGYLSYHLRNGRLNSYGSAPIAYTIKADNRAFKPYKGKQRLFNAVAIESEWDADCGEIDNQVMKLRLAVQGESCPLCLEQMELNLAETDCLADIDRIRIYSTGKTARSKQRNLLYEGIPQNKMKLTLSSDAKVQLSEGLNYILITADINQKAKPGNRIRIKVNSFTLSGRKYKPSLKETAIYKQVTENSVTNPNCFRVLQWNIWHGGTHVPNEGKARIVELLKASRADIITMQEGYGFQQEIAAALNYNLQTPSPTDNLALFTRYSLRKLPSSHTFRSNPAIVQVGNNRFVLVNACWLRYANNPDYTGSYADTAHNPTTWMVQDSVLPMSDVAELLCKDINPIVNKRAMPVILGGDFNSCSHLDWTREAAFLHAGFGPVAFPVSRFMQEQGYKDSFREVNPDEVKRPEGTFAGIYEQLDFSRIDFIYYKGKIRAVSSKIVQTSPEIDDIWASDHSAVLTTFVWEE